MKHRSTFLFVATAFLISGCTAKTPEPNQETTPGVLEAPQKAVKALSASELLGQKLKNGMAYEDLRKTVLADGWLPLVTPECKENVGGEAKICDQQLEVEACSGDGHCNMLFAHHDGDSKLKVGTYGDLVKFFEFSKQVPVGTLAGGTCEQEGYQTFFDSFVHSESVRKSHTARTVQVRNYTHGKLINAEFSGFKIGTLDYSWVYQDTTSDNDNPVRLNLKIINSDNSFRVEFQKAEFEYRGDGEEELIRTYGSSGAYLFELQDGCWRLTTEFR